MKDFKIIEKALDLIVNDLDESGVDDSVWTRVFAEICSDCDSRLGCKDCIKKYYINKARNNLKGEWYGLYL